MKFLITKHHSSQKIFWLVVIISLAQFLNFQNLKRFTTNTISNSNNDYAKVLNQSSSL